MSNALTCPLIYRSSSVSGLTGFGARGGCLLVLLPSLSYRRVIELDVLESHEGVDRSGTIVTLSGRCERRLSMVVWLVEPVLFSD